MYVPNFNTLQLDGFECYERDSERSEKNGLVDAIRKSCLLNKSSYLETSLEIKRKCGITHDKGVSINELPTLENFFLCNVNIYYDGKLIRSRYTYPRTCNILIHNGQYFLIKNKREELRICGEHCEHNGCKRRSSFSFNGEKDSRFCSNHRLKGMINIKRKKCKFCDKSPVFGYKGCGASHCQDHKKKGMVWIELYELGKKYEIIAQWKQNLIKALEDKGECEKFIQGKTSTLDQESEYIQKEMNKDALEVIRNKELREEAILKFKAKFEKNYRKISFGEYNIYSIIIKRLSLELLKFICENLGLKTGNREEMIGEIENNT